MGATGNEIRDITGTSKTDSQLNVFIVAADLKTARVASCDSSLTDSELESISNWYASYLLTRGNADKSLNVSKRKLEQFEITYGGSSSESVSKRYYDTANDLSNGCLAALSEEKSQFLVL